MVDINFPFHLNIITTISAVSIAPISILFFTYTCFKNRKIKRDILLIERFLFLFLFNSGYVSWVITSNLYKKHYELDIYLDVVMQLSFNFISVFYYFNTIACFFEEYKLLRNPFHFFFSIFYRYKNNILWEFLICLGVTLGIVCWFLSIEGYIENDLEIFQKYYFVMISMNIGVISIYGVMSLTILIPIVLSKLLIDKYQNPSKESESSHNFINIIRFVLMLLYALLCLGIRIIKENSLVILIASYYFPIMILMDSLLEMISIKISTFYQYKLKRTKIRVFYSCLKIKRFSKKNPLYYQHKKNKNAKIDFSKPTKEGILSYFQNNLNFDISQLCLESCEYLLNVALASLSLIYDSMKNNNLIEVSGMPVELQETEEPLIHCQEKESNYRLYSFNKHSFKDINNTLLTNYNSSIMDKIPMELRNLVSIEIKSFYPNQTRTILKNSETDLIEIKNSFLSHASQFPYLISLNSAQYYYHYLNTFTLETKDKNLLIEIFDDDCIKEKGNNTLIEDYLKYLTLKSHTFIPTIIGIFKVKINKFKPFFLFISKNSFIENIPKNLYNYWQVMRYSHKKEIELLKTSKDTNLFSISEDSIFKDGKKIIIDNYLSFCSFFRDNISFLKDLNITRFSLLILYYEFDHENIKPISFEIGSTKQKESNLPFRISNIKRISKINDNPSFAADFNSCLFTRETKGFEANYNEHKCILFFSFAGILEFGWKGYNNIDYDSFCQGFLSNFDEEKPDDILLQSITSM